MIVFCFCFLVHGSPRDYVGLPKEAKYNNSDESNERCQLY